MTTIRLGWYEAQFAAFVGVSRAVSGLYGGRQLEPGRADLTFERNVLGAIGEWAVAAALDRNWRPIIGALDTTRGDVAGCQVRATTGPSLIVKDHDPDDFPYLLAVVKFEPKPKCLTVLLPGWIDGADAKDSQHWRAVDKGRGIHQAAYFVPQKALHPFGTLAERIGEREAQHALSMPTA